MKSDTDIPFINASWKIVRTFSLLAGVFLLVGIPAVLALLYKSTHPDQIGSGLETTCVLAAALTVPGSIAMIFSALLTIPTARRTDRCFGEFKSGEFLVHWIYPPAQWAVHVNSESQRLRKVRWVTFIFISVVIAMVGLLIALAVPGSVSAKVVRGFFVLLGAVGFGGFIVAIVDRYSARRIAQMTAQPTTYISKGAFYSAGDFNFWGSGLRRLQSVRLVPGQPMKLEIIIGLSKTARRVTGAADIINLASSRPTYASQYMSRHLILVPEGETASAENVVAVLTGSELRR